MAKESGAGIDQHKLMAMGKRTPQEESDGPEPLHSGIQHMDAVNGSDSRHLKEPMRTTPPPVSHAPMKKHAQAQVDHGPHHMRSKGAKRGY